jgi:hypothetical protein
MHFSSFDIIAQDDTIFFEFNLKIDVMVSLSNHEDNY